MRKIELPCREVINAALLYNPETGELIRKRTSNILKSNRADGATLVKFGRGKCYLAHRCIWKLMTGEDPGKLEIDHINGDRTDNSWSNLRLATRQQNMSNLSGEGSVRYDKRRKHWRADFQHKGKKVCAGVSVCPLLAHMKYVDKSRELRGKFSRV